MMTSILISLIIVGMGFVFLAYKGIKKKIIQFVFEEIYKFEKECRPKRILLIRHGNSMANGNYDILQDIPDNTVHLSDLGKEQAREAGKVLKQIVKKESCRFYVSPYTRTIETYMIVKSMLPDNKIKVTFDPRLREQEYGNLQKDMEEQFEKQKKCGLFYYRFVDGESGADVYDRTSMFVGTLFREFISPDYENHENVVIVSHSLTIMFFMMYFLNYSPEEFKRIREPTNAEVWILEKNENGRYDVKTDIYLKPGEKYQIKHLRI